MVAQVTVLIPAYNESAYITDTIYGVKAAGIADRILVIDDGSRDKTAQIAACAGAEVIKLGANEGKGNALNIGIASICSEITVFLDGDIGKSAVELRKLVEPILAGDADMTIGILPPPTHKGGLGIVKNTARWLVYKNTGKRLDGALSGQRAVRQEVLKDIGSIPGGFAAEVGINIKALELGYKIMEVPVKMFHRESKRDLKGFMHRGRQFYDILKFCVKKGGGCGL